MLNKIYEFCKKANYILIFLLLLTLWILILFSFGSGFREGGRYNKTEQLGPVNNTNIDD